MELQPGVEVKMIAINDIHTLNFADIPIDRFWNVGYEQELKMHRIHAYPAKFPAFITTKAIAYAKENGLTPRRIADFFCGCGTVAFESKRAAIDFWGCDINPVATMIAKVKSRASYQKWRLERYFNAIIECFRKNNIYPNPEYYNSNYRLQYWFDIEHYNDLSKLKQAIELCTPEHSDYRYFFICAFSNILKATSKWLTKSIKPQIDPQKCPMDVIRAYTAQVSFMIAASEQANLPTESKVEIITANILEQNKFPQIDLIVTSPPYVTSYEYADLHQLSSLWLGYASDYRELRIGSIGSLNPEYNFRKEIKHLNKTGHYIVTLLLDQVKEKARDVAKYFLDMQTIAVKSFEMLSPGGMALFVIGNTEYKGVYIDNAKHLSESMLEAGFSSVLATKRKISNKILTPYRDARGHFSTNNKGRKIYAEEFIIIGRR